MANFASLLLPGGIVLLSFVLGNITWLLLPGAVFVLCFVLGLLLFTGRGAFLIAGYNTMSAKEKARYNKKALCRIMGIYLFFIDLWGMGLMYLTYSDREIPIAPFIAAFLLVTLGLVLYVNGSKRIRPR